MGIPSEPIKFYFHPITLSAFLFGFFLLALTLLLIKVPKLRIYFKPLFKLYYYIALTPIYFGAIIIYTITIGKVNIIQKLRNIDFFKDFQKLYLNPKDFFEYMRLTPKKYYLWVGIYICMVQITLDYLLIVWITEILYGGKDSIIFGVLSTQPPSISNPIIRWLYMAIIGNLVWIPTKFAIYFLVFLFHKYDKSSETARPWYDKVRLTYIAWAYIITADSIWCLGMVLSLLFYLIVPSWWVLIFTWICVIICGIIELIYQQYSLQGLFKLKSAKGFLFWLLSMLPFVLTAFLLVTFLGTAINSLFI